MTTSELHVLVVASDAGRALAPLDERHDPALLPIVGKSVLEHVLEAITRLAPTHVTVAASRDLAGVRRLVRDGTRWGVPMHTVSVRLDEPAASIVARERSLRRADLLVVPCERIIDAPLAAPLERLRSIAETAAGASGGTPQAVVDPHTALRWYPLGCDPDAVLPCAPLDVAVHRIDSLAAYHALSLAAAGGALETLRFRGRARAPGLTTGFLSRLHPGSRISGTVFAGSRCRVHRSCRLSGTVVLNHGVAMDRGTDIENSVVLDDTYIGERLSVRDAIVAGDMIVRVDTGAVLKITDRFIAADLGRSVYDEHFGELSHRLAGTLLVVLTLPLWPLAALCAALAARRGATHAPVLERERLVGNRHVPGSGGRRAFTTVRFTAGPRSLRRLPLLVAVAQGHLRLVGVSPLAPEDCMPREDGWQRVRDAAPIGLIGPTQLHLGLDAPLEQRLFSDAVYARTGRGFASSLLLLGGALRRLVVPPSPGGDEPWMVELLSD